MEVSKKESKMYTVEQLIADLVKMTEKNPELLKRRVVAYAHEEHLMHDAKPTEGIMCDSTSDDPDEDPWYCEQREDQYEEGVSERVLFIG